MQPMHAERRVAMPHGHDEAATPRCNRRAVKPGRADMDGRDWRPAMTVGLG